MKISTSFYQLLFLSFLLPAASFAQLSDKEKMTEALYLMDEKRFSEALPLLEELYENDKENANINFNIGVAILNSNEVKSKAKALPYLKTASENTSPNYRAFNHREKRAPVDTWYYLGQAQHSQNDFDAAQASFEKFRTFINDKHFLWEEIDKSIKMAEYAKKAIKNPVNIVSTNLGGKLNSFYADYSPVVRIDESAIYFTSRRLRKDSSNANIFDPIDGKLYEDIYVSFNEEEGWSEPNLLNINTIGHEATINLSIDGKTLFIYKDENGNGELFYSKLEDDSAGIETWSEPQKFGSDINSDAYETHVAISPDQKTLYYVSDREGGLGGKDIYYCNRLPTGNWALSQNLGDIINTKYDEDGVFMHPDGKTLYFSSNGHNSMGGYDIMSSILTDSGWTTPKNIGYPINSVDDDVFFVTTPDGKRAYYSSFKEDGYGEKDIYMLQLLDAEESNLTLYRGEFTFVDRFVPPEGAQVTITNNNTGELVGIYTPRQRDGQFSAILAPNNSYHFVYEADEYETYEEDIYVPEGTSYQEIYKDIKLKPVRVGKGMTSIVPAMMEKADVSGVISKIDQPLANTRMVLYDENGNKLQQTETDQNGEFTFKQLDPSKTYLVKAYKKDNNQIIYNFDLSAENDRGEVVRTKELNDTTHIFVPSAYPYEFYGIRAKSISGRVKSGDEAVAGVKVKLMDADRNLIDQTITDQYGEFNFSKLDLDNSYRLVFEGNLPEDPIILITNDQGEVMAFRKVKDGVYEYVPSKKNLGNRFIGQLTNNGQPISGAPVILRDKDGNIIAQTTTDEEGRFQFDNKDLNQAHQIEFPEGVPETADVNLNDEFNNSLKLKNLGNGVFEYMPDKGQLGTKFIGLAKNANGTALSGVSVSLKDENGKLISQSTTDGQGRFEFSGLDLDQAYRIEFDENFPDDATLIIMDEFGNELTFNNMGDGVFEYVPNRRDKGSVMKGVAKKNGKVLSGVKVELLSADGKVLQQSTTDEAGAFAFEGLDLNSSYLLRFEDFPDDANIVLLNEFGQELAFSKRGDGLYEYMPDGISKFGSEIQATVRQNGKKIGGFTVELLNDKNQKIDQTVVDKTGEFTFKQLNLDNRYRIAFDENLPDDAEITFRNEYGQILTFMKVKKGVYEYVPRPAKYAFKSYTIGIDGNPDFADTYPKPGELKDVISYYQKYFPYNAKDINEKNQAFIQFVNDIADLVKSRGFADIIITSSASKVPTKTWKSNSILTKRRANDTKRLLEKIFTEKGLEEDQFNFIDINTLITGPEYNYDHVKNRSAYEKHQYVRIFIK